MGSHQFISKQFKYTVQITNYPTRMKLDLTSIQMNPVDSVLVVWCNNARFSSLG